MSGQPRLYNQVMRYWWRQDSYAMPVIARYGTGGGNMPVVLESRQERERTGTCEGMTNVVIDALPFDTTQVTSPMNWSHPKWGDPCHPIANQGHIPKVVTLEVDGEEKTAVSIGNGQTNNIAMSTIANALDCMHDQQAIMKTGGQDMPESVVRRLTPNECCALQGFPRGWVDLGDWKDSDGKTHKEADTPKYKALGNSIAVGFQNERSGFWCWLMKRISAQYERRATMGSVFSGIEGFGLAWAAVNGPESVRWSSEVDEFCIAVIKKHFGDEDAGLKGDFYEAINGG